MDFYIIKKSSYVRTFKDGFCCESALWGEEQRNAQLAKGAKEGPRNKDHFGNG